MPPSTRRKRAVRRIRALLAVAAGLSEERAATAVEYAILLASIAAICVVAMAALGVSVHDLFDALHF
ncbi:MAG: Flp family type IVb pilin [Actinomycetota bacterium]|nr:Flp family type IVb pilin [Actinomycetota bacterium]